MFASTAAAQVSDVYEAPFASATGTFEWDVFSGSGAGPHTPDVTDEGGSASLSATFTVDPGNGPPFPLVSSTANIYSAGTFPDYTAALSGLDASGSNTTVVLQLASIGDVFSGFQLDGVVPTEFLNRGSVENLGHGTAGAEFDTQFYWAEWQLDGDDRDAFDLTFSTIPHASFAGVRVDYLTSDGLVGLQPPSLLSLVGDFDRDMDVDLDDLDQFNGQIGTDVSGEASALDLNFDGTIGEDDFERHYSQLVRTSNGAIGTAQGDINLDGKVDVLSDAFMLVSNLGSSATSWGEGDLDANGTVDVLSDAFALVANLGFNNAAGAAPATAAVPEPSSIGAMMIGSLGVASRRRRIAQRS